jgi:hypothetical protein
MTWKDIFAPIGIILTILFILQIISGLYVRFYLYPQIEKQYQELGEMGREAPLGRDIQLIDASCVTDSYYNLTLKNATKKIVSIGDLNFYIDDSEVICKGITSLEPGVSATCKISQFATKGQHALTISGRIRGLISLLDRKFEMSTTVHCDK